MQALSSDPFAGDVLIFRSKRSDRLKLLVWDGSGLCLVTKRLEPGAFRQPGDRSGCAARLGWRNHRHWRGPSWAAPADDPITLSAAACRNCFDSRSSLTARERTTAPTMVERIAMALPLGSSPSASPTQLPSSSRYFLDSGFE